MATVLLGPRAWLASLVFLCVNACWAHRPPSAAANTPQRNGSVGRTDLVERSSLVHLGPHRSRYWRKEAQDQAAALASAADPQLPRLLATIKAQPITIGDGSSLNFRSVVPVFGGGESFVAFLLHWDDKLWAKAKGLSLFCASKDGKHRAPMQKWGGETGAWYKAFMAFRCDWPEASKDQACHSIVVQEGEGFADRGTVESCHDTGMYANTYSLAACIPPIFENSAHLESSGLLKLPQWIEYNAMHGVEQFVVYTMPGSDPRIYDVIDPYVKSGLVTQVYMQAASDLRPTDDSANQLTGNDCLYRMKHRAKWLLPFIDADEYLNFNPNGVHESSFSAGISALLKLKKKDWWVPSLLEHNGRARGGAASQAAKGVHSISFGRYTFRHPLSPKEELQVSSQFREAKLAHLCPKYVVNPALVHVLFNHWATSWEPSAGNLMMPPESLVGFHYRTLDTAQTTVEDRSLQAEAPALEGKLKERLGSPWPAFASTLYGGGSSFLDGRPALDLESSIASQVPNFVRYVNSLTVPTFIAPPGVAAEDSYPS